jgi:hypothetical protein
VPGPGVIAVLGVGGVVSFIRVRRP